ncbi:MAG TPA: phosphodiester glycosidase family protein [Fimbriimonadaceae bacterium]|jgi:hypothetical protein
MRKRLALVFLALCATCAQAQVWEKYLAPGLTYRMEVEAALPRTIHALHFDLHSNAVHFEPELGQLKVYNDDKTKGRATISDLVKKTGAIAGINASFFPYTGRPYGLMIHNGELISTPYPNRPQFGWGPDGIAVLGSVTLAADLKMADGSVFTLDSINDEAKPNWLCLDTDTGGYALTKPGTGACAIVHMLGGPLKPDGDAEVEVEGIYDNTALMPIQKGNAALMATGTKTSIVDGLKPGQRLTIQTKTTGLDWKKFSNTVGGGPVLLNHGQKIVDWSAEGFDKDFSLKRHPRSAIGIDGHGGLWLVAVDGRQSESAGATLDEMADIMARLGCQEAMNLDGGGSTTLNILGVTVNRPSDNVEREVANAVLFFGPLPGKDDADMIIKTPSALKNGDKVFMRVVKSDGTIVPDSEILWAANGAGWIDQGGLLHVDKAGTVALSAFVHGKILTSSLITDAAAVNHK